MLSRAIVPGAGSNGANASALKYGRIYAVGSPTRRGLVMLGRGLAGGIGDGGGRTGRGRLRRGSQGERGEAFCRDDDEQDCD